MENVLCFFLVCCRKGFELDPKSSKYNTIPILSECLAKKYSVEVTFHAQNRH